jgi:hypothetical protein
MCCLVKNENNYTHNIFRIYIGFQLNMSTNLVFAGKFLMKSIAKLSLPVRSYSEISHIILMVKNTIYDFFVNNTKLIQKQE